MKSFSKLVIAILAATYSLHSAWAQSNSILANANQQVSAIISGASLPASIVWNSISSTCSSGTTPAVGSISVQPQVLKNLPGGMICSIANGPNCTMVIRFCANSDNNNTIPVQLANKSIWIGPLQVGANGNTANAQYTNLVCATDIITNPLLSSPAEGTPIQPVSGSSLGINTCYFSQAPQTYIQLLMINPNISNTSGATL